MNKSVVCTFLNYSLCFKEEKFMGRDTFCGIDICDTVATYAYMPFVWNISEECAKSSFYYAYGTHSLLQIRIQC